MRTPAEEAARLADELRALARRLEAGEGAALFTREDVENIVDGRLHRERKKRRRVEAERDELEAELDRLRLSQPAEGRR